MLYVMELYPLLPIVLPSSQIAPPSAIGSSSRKGGVAPCRALYNTPRQQGSLPEPTKDTALLMEKQRGVRTEAARSARRQTHEKPPTKSHSKKHPTSVCLRMLHGQGQRDLTLYRYHVPGQLSCFESLSQDQTRKKQVRTQRNREAPAESKLQQSGHTECCRSPKLFISGGAAALSSTSRSGSFRCEKRVRGPFGVLAESRWMEGPTITGVKEVTAMGTTTKRAIVLNSILDDVILTFESLAYENTKVLVAVPK